MVDKVDRVVSFSLRPLDTQGREEVKKLKEYSEKTGVSFSFLMVKAISQLNKGMKL